MIANGLSRYDFQSVFIELVWVKCDEIRDDNHLRYIAPIRIQSQRPNTSSDYQTNVTILYFIRCERSIYSVFHLLL